MQVGDTATDEYFSEVNRRSSALFESVFQPTDRVYIVFLDYKYKRHKLRAGNFVFQQISHLNKKEIIYSTVHRLYEPDDRFDSRNMAVIETQTFEINYENVLRAIGNTDFPPRAPRLDKKGVFSSKEVFFINIDMKAIFRMYDDRGLDIIASDIRVLRPVYEKYQHWLLDSARAKIHSVFQENG